MATLVLVHGAGHGAWCWELLSPLLEAQGHVVWTPDLPCDDPDAGIADYADAVLATIEPSAEPVVVVGHSLGGLTIPVVASRTRVHTLVFLAGIVGMPNQSLADLAEVDADRDGALEASDLRLLDNGTFLFTPEGASRVLYHDCEEGVAAAAARRLRPQRSLWKEVSPFSTWPSSRMESIVCTDDRVVNRAWAERTARERLGIEPLLLNSGHSPMLSQPAQLARMLDRVAAA